MYEIVTVEQKGTFVRNGERKILGVNGQHMNFLIQQWKIITVKKLYKVRLFLREDIKEKCKEIEGLREKYKPFNTSKKDEIGYHDGLFLFLLQINLLNSPVFVEL
ncbi:hypothetical protein ABEX39_26595 [Bacillus albus]|uniref:hypothetical protein n=1 Tax=Bacillus TaxID=1386 RepID=UPI000BF37A4D|nr:MULTISPECIES: hypothetical protein [Bacillus cereus group]MBF7155020.1 hypothetical protein [Bacillus albus]MCC2347499.1 hypothetical protein [Bacillus anthracis]PFM44240.1 hypothetical protein COJ45_25420 [Bacillus cereus]PGS23560.1 hypothetical protein COC59_17885 [Bacillus cereus]